MDICKVTVAVNGRDLQAIVKAGVMATIETGALTNGIQTPKDKINIIVGRAGQGLSAWVQVSQFDVNKTASITHEGWISEGTGSLSSFSNSISAKASLSRVDSPSPEVIKCQEDAAFGLTACCTSNGSGCYVKCCSGCCSDPAGCPGASCCP
jgi:hypothetical protein